MEKIKIGIPSSQKGSSIPEKRVSLSPSACKELIELGAEIYLESGAGESAGFSDEEYKQKGVNIVYSRDEVFLRTDIVAGINPPSTDELRLLKENHVIFGFLHLAVRPKEIYETFVSKKITSIGYEIIQEEDETLPVLRVSSQIAGKLAPQIAGRLLESERGGLGILLGGIPGIPPADVVIIGAGTLGTYAARSFLGLGASVYMLDISRSKLERIDEIFGGKVVTALATYENIYKFVKFANVLILAVLVPGERAPIIVTREMVKSMRNGSVIIDFSIDQGGACETSRLTPTESFVYKEFGITHFCVPNVPSFVARTASHALSNALLPYFKRIVKDGIDVIRECVPLWNGCYTFKGKFTKKHPWSEGYPTI
ncbi:MAG: alanine dehydrogenase [Candidatus Hydrothermales bacterium]